MDSNLTKLQRWLVLFNVSMSVFMATLDSSIVNIALPVIAKELSVNISSVQWVVTSYLLTISALLLIWGKVSDIYGKKFIFASGFIIFTIGSVFCGLSWNLEMLVFSRILQAVGASSMMALSQGIVTLIFPPEERGKALGITGTTVAIGSLMGPSLGGVLVHAAGWKSIFFINLPIGIIGTVLTFLLIPNFHEGKAYKGFDYKGAILFVTSLVMLFSGLLFMQEGVISLKLLIPVIIAASALLLCFISFERKIENPLINLSLFKSKVFSMGLTSAFLSFVATFSTMLFIPFYLQMVLKLDTLQAGLLISFYPAATAILAPVSGALSDKISYRPLTVLGLTINTFTLGWIATLNEASSRVEIIILMALLGIGVAIFQSPNNSSVMGAVPREQLGVAGGINALFRNLGMVSGITFSVMIFSLTTKININSISRDNAFFDTALFLRGFRIVMIFAASVCALGAIISLTRAVGKGTKISDSRV